MDIRSQAVTVAAPWSTRSGNFLRLVSASLPVNVVFYRLGSEIGRWDSVTTGTAGHVEDELGAKMTFDRALITTSSDQTVKIAVGFGSVNITAANVTIVNATVIDTAADVPLAAAATTLILAADTTRREALISNLSGNVSLIRVGDVSTGAARGIQVGQGQTLTLQGTEAIYGYSATLQSVSVATVKD